MNERIFEKRTMNTSLDLRFWVEGSKAMNFRAIAVCVTLALGMLAAPLGADAQTAKRVYRIGALNEAWAPNHPAVEGLKAGLKELGLEEARDVTFDIRFTEGRPAAAPAAAAALVSAGVDLIFTSNDSATRAAKAATQSIPIVFTLVGDPVAAGFVKEIANPGGNLTGVSSLHTELVPKRLEVLKAMVPSLRRVWAIYYASDPSSLVAVKKAQEAAPLLRLELVTRAVQTPGELARALKGLRPGDGLLPPPIATLDIPDQMLQASLSARLPIVFGSAFWTDYGALVSYGTDYYADGRQAARLVTKILRGERPQDLPVEGTNKIELIINLKTARMLGVTIPRELLLRAEKVIQ
jgi:putative ABC transport system substrate-binding protein